MKFKKIYKILKGLDRPQKISFLKVQVLNLLSVISELISIFLITSFVSDLANGNSQSEIKNILSFVFNFNDNLVELHLVVTIIFVLISSFLSIISTWKFSQFAFRTGTEIGDKLYKYYILSDYIYHLTNKSPLLVKNITNECHRLTGQVLLPILVILSKGTLVLFLSIFLFIKEPLISISILLVILFLYLFIYSLIKRRINLNGSIMSKSQELRYGLIYESLRSIRDIKIFESESDFLNEFESQGVNFYKAAGFNNAFGILPRFLLEIFVFIGLVSFSYSYIYVFNNSVSSYLALLTVLGAVSFRIFPAIQAVYNSTIQFNGNYASYIAIEDDIKFASKMVKSTPSPINFNNTFELKNISYKYPNSSEHVFTDFNLKIHKNIVLGISGKSGSGKSTLIDIISGLLPINSGEIYIDNVLYDSNLADYNWTSKIAYVHQDNIILDGTILQNVIFSMNSDIVDIESVNFCLKKAGLNLESLGLDLNSACGENGINLSGGQKQRLCIARALYKNSEILILDEATSSLDLNTESLIVDVLTSLKGKITIIIVAHRLKTLEFSDKIIKLENGSAVEYDSFNNFSKSL